MSSLNALDISRHLIVWIASVVLLASAPTLVRLYVARLQRRTRQRTDAVLARFNAVWPGSSPESPAEKAGS